MGRVTTYNYPNHIDLASVTQLTAGGVQQTIGAWLYNSQHEPTQYTDAAGKNYTLRYIAAHVVKQAPCHPPQSRAQPHSKNNEGHSYQPRSWDQE